MTTINDFTEEKICTYKDETYSVRDNGAVMRHSKPEKRKRKLDDEWTFGTSINEKGYPCIAQQVIHRIVATAFLGDPPSKSHVVDHINTNRQDNRSSNLRWVTRLENIILNPITCKKIKGLTGMKIEDVLKDITVLHNFNLPPNISWMRAVNQKESDSCLENLTKWANQNSYKNVSAGGSLGEWIFRTRKNIFKYEYPEGFEKPDGTKPDIIMSLSPNAAQDKTRWRIPAEFPCCPTELTETPLQDYFENLKQGKIFCRNKQYSSSVLETALYKDNIIVKTENCETNAVKPWSLCTITFENNLFVHRVYMTCFEKDGADKFFLVLQGRENEWTGGTVFDELC